MQMYPCLLLMICPQTVSVLHISIIVALILHGWSVHGTADDIGAALVYKANSAQASAIKLQQSLANLRQDLAHVNRQLVELPILLGNCARSPGAPLQNPTLAHNGWAPDLTLPNPRTRNELFHFTSKPIV